MTDTEALGIDLMIEACKLTGCEWQHLQDKLHAARPDLCGCENHEIGE